MGNTHIALKKILTTMVPKKYPVISNITIIDDSYGVDYISHHYKVFLGVRPNDISAFDNDEVRDYVRHVSKYVLGDNEIIQQILFYNPDN